MYPKTTVPAADYGHPNGPETLEEAYGWAQVYLERIAESFGKGWLIDRLRSWRWTFSSAFSGLGAPESALYLEKNVSF